ncbi:MAG TPA: dihydropteroate synthase [Bacteroidetes bacterium]|nr:dihydropteroate synthase [Bacteroidota bacterium]
MRKDNLFYGKKSLVIDGCLFELERPLVMGILNLTPDSFYDGGRYFQEDVLLDRFRQMKKEGVDIIDVGAYSTRPGAKPVSEEEEWERLQKGLDVIRQDDPEIPLSVDTFRSLVAERAVSTYNVGMVNDISGGDMDEDMFETVARLGVAYVLMHMQGTPQTMQENPHYKHVVKDIIFLFSKKIHRLLELGVNDIILDPGFGFGKTIKHNYQLLKGLRAFREAGLPLMVGVSRKSMIWKLLDITPGESLTGTVVLHTLALIEGADILRVHDVKAAREVIEIVEYWKKTELEG